MWVLLAGVFAVAVIGGEYPGRLSRTRRFFCRRKRRGAKKEETDMGMLITEVATRLRAGASAEKAWAQSLLRHGFVPVPEMPVLTEEGIPRCLEEISKLNPLRRRLRRIPKSVEDALPATFAVCTLAARTGAPMADTLDSCALEITLAAEAKAARQIALSGPMASARLLGILPIFGLLTGVALSADPFRFLLCTLPGKICLVSALLFEAAGLISVRILVHRALKGE